VAIPVPGSLRALMDEVVLLEQRAADALAASGEVLATGDLVRVYRWQPYSMQVPAFFNWIATAPFEQRDQIRYRDNVQLLVRCAIAHTDTDQDMGDIEVLADYMRDVLDREFNLQRSDLHPGGPLNGVVTRAYRQGMRTAVWTIGGAQLLGMEFPCMFWLDRQIPLT
jgi:hypothetical protein